MVMGSLVCTVTGGTMVFPGEGFDALATLQALQDERCTAVHGVPAMCTAQLDQFDFRRFDLSALREGIMADSPCPVEVMKRVVTDLHMSEVTVAYGMTETSPVLFQSAPTAPLDMRVSTVGRMKDLLIRGGENVCPREVAESLFRHPAVAQVQVFGLPDAKYGEEGCAWVVLKPGSAATECELRSVRQDPIAHDKVPGHFRFVTEIPMTVTGKAQKFVMRKAMVDRLRAKYG